MKIKLLKPIKTRTVSASDYLVMVAKRPGDIESSRFIPPKIGGKGFGSVQVTFKNSELVDA